jgi:hypothetical protein
MVVDLLFKYFHLSPQGIARRVFGPLFRRPAHSFALLFGEMDAIILKESLPAACRHGLKQFTRLIKVNGAENIPAHGPLLIVSNHAGAYDVLVILSQVGRNDVKVIAGELALLHNFPALQQRLIFTTFQPGSGMQAARQSLRHLKEGGALLLFASAGIDPDPALDPQAARQDLQRWKPSLDMFLQYVPEARVVVSLVRSIAAPNWARHPLTRIGKRPIEKRRIGEMLQIMEQLLFPGSRLMQPHIQFSSPLTVTELKGDARLALIRKAEEMLASHR